MKQPTHKTAHSQAPTHMPKIQLAKELFFCLPTEKKTILQHGLADMDISFENYKVSRKLYRVGKKYKT